MTHGTQRRNSRHRFGGTNIEKLAPSALLSALGGRRDPIVKETADQVPDQAKEAS